MLSRRVGNELLSWAIGLLICLWTTHFRFAAAESVFAPGEKFVEEVILKDLPISTAIAFASPTRAYLAIKIGQILTVDNGVVSTVPFIDMTDIVNKQTDRGLLGLAVDPDFPNRPYVYVAYVYDPPGFERDRPDPRVIRIARLTADSKTNFQTAVPDSLKVIVGAQGTAENIADPIPDGDPNLPERASCMTGLTMDGTPIDDCIPCDSRSHSAGTLIFGSSRQLFISLGDGADYEGPNRIGLRTQNLDSLSGRILRVNVDTGEGIPGNPWYDPDNPSSNRSRTWSYGFRNPFRITLNPLDDEPFVGDVGTSYFEEINTGKGRNFGWPCYEGGFVDRTQQEGPATASVQQVGYRQHERTREFCNDMYQRGQEFVKAPFFNYRHKYDDTGKDLGASITGLSFYRGKVYPSYLHGALFFADYAQRWIRYLTFSADGTPIAHDFASEKGTGLGAVELLQGPDESLYGVYIDLETRTSQVRRFRPITTENLPPVIKASLSPTVGEPPLTVQALASGSFDPNGSALEFSWDLGDGRTLSTPDTTFKYDTPGIYTVQLTVTEDTDERLSTTETFTVRVGAQRVIAKIIEPTDGAFFEIGQPISLRGADGTEQYPNADFTWSILQVHNRHLHLVSEEEGLLGEFTPTEHSDNTSYRVCLHMEVDKDNSDSQCVNLIPRTGSYRLESRPSGATIAYVDEEVELTSPITIYPIVGSKQTIRAQKLHNGQSFLGWTDGVLSQTRRFTAEAGRQSFKAVYRNLRPRVVFRKRSVNVKRSSVQLDASASFDPEGATLRYRWLFSDGTRATGSSVRKRFKKTGRYRVTLSVRDPLGAISRRRKTVWVRQRGIRLSR